MSQRQCKKYRKAIKKMEKEQERFVRLLNHLNHRPPVWRLLAYIKWEREWRDIL